MMAQTSASTDSPLISAVAFSKTAPVPADHRIAYGDHESQFGDLYLPPSQGCHTQTILPVLILFHGGCWKEHLTLEPLGQLSRAIADKGNVAVWNVEYRRLGKDGGGWPHTFTDAALAVDFIRDGLATTRFPELHLDPTRVVAAGHSAGGHLALWLAGRKQLPKSSPICTTADPIAIQKVIALAPVCDLERAYGWKICPGAIDNVIGGLPRESWLNYQHGSPSNLLPLGVRHVTIQGSKDALVPLEYVRPFVTQAKGMGDDAVLKEVAHVGHFEIVVASHEAGRSTIEIIVQEVSALL